MKYVRKLVLIRSPWVMAFVFCSGMILSAVSALTGGPLWLSIVDLVLFGCAAIIMWAVTSTGWHKTLQFFSITLEDHHAQAKFMDEEGALLDEAIKELRRAGHSYPAEVLENAHAEAIEKLRKAYEMNAKHDDVSKF